MRAPPQVPGGAPVKKSLVILFSLFVACGGRAPIVSGENPDGGGDLGPCDNDNSVVEVPLEERRHIPEDQTPVYHNNPPVSGEHYPIWAKWQIYTRTVPRGYWVHNLEHGGVIFLYRQSSTTGPDASPSIVAALRSVYNRIPLDAPCDHRRVVVTPDPLLDVPWAVTVSGPENESGPLGVGYVIKADCIKSQQDLVQFAVAHRNHSYEDICDDGQFVP